MKVEHSPRSKLPFPPLFRYHFAPKASHTFSTISQHRILSNGIWEASLKVPKVAANADAKGFFPVQTLGFGPVFASFDLLAPSIRC